MNTYFINTGRESLCLYINTGGKEELVKFTGYGDGKVRFFATDEKIQAAIEASPRFLSGEIQLESGRNRTAGGKKDAVKAAKTEYPEVTDIQTAKDILKGAPYSISPVALITPERIRTQADKAGVSFPNLVWE